MRRAIKRCVFLMVMSVSVIFMSLAANAGQEVDGNWQYDLNGDGTAAISGYIGTESGSLTIPSSVGGHTVTRIDNYAFNSATRFTGTLTIPDTVTTIGENAFANCAFTGTLSLPSNLVSIGEYAFGHCEGFTGNLTIPNTVTSIGKSAFTNCGFTGSLTLGSSIEDIGEEAFYQCAGFTGSLKIPDSVKTLGKYAFCGCGFSGGLTIGSGLSEIKENTFENCTKLTGNLVIPANITKICNCAFRGCNNFKGVITIPNGVTSIGDFAFSGCEGLTGNLIIPDSVTYIGGSAFADCSHFSGNLTIPSGVVTIENMAFSNCNRFNGTLTIPSSVTSIGLFAFSPCSGITKVINNSNCTVSLSAMNSTDLPVEWRKLDTDEIVTEITNGTAYRVGGGSGESGESGGSGDGKGSSDNTGAVTVSDNKPMAYSTETKGDYKISYNHEIPFWGKSKLTAAAFGDITVSYNSASYKVTKAKVNKKKRLIQITGLQGADKQTVKAVKKATKGANGLKFAVNPYYVKTGDKVSAKAKKDGAIKSVKVSISGKDYKAKKEEWSFDSSTKIITFKGTNLSGSYKMP